MSRRAFGKASHELVEEFLCAYLEMKWVPAILDAYIEELFFSLAGAYARDGVRRTLRANMATFGFR
jgi:hypothetical protein